MLIARAINSLRKRSGHCFGIANHDTMELVDAAAQLEAMAYVAAQPVAAGAVPYGYQWPGVRSRPQDLGRPMRIRRPDTPFFARKKLPDYETIVFERPPALEGADWFVREQLTEMIVVAEREARELAARKGLKFQGRRAVRRLIRFREPSRSRRSVCSIRGSSAKI